MSKNPSIIVTKDAFHLARKGADLFVKTTRECISKKGQCLVALSGGSTPRAMHRLLAEGSYQSDISWRDINLCWVDDRMVPYDNPASNFGAAKKDFLDHVSIPSKQIHPMPADMPVQQAATKYQKELEALFNDSIDFPSFDLVFLGIGQDGHTASLFPGHSALDEKEKWIVPVKGGDPDVHRLTMTLPLLNRSRVIVFLASGTAKASVLKKILENQRAGLPAQGIAPKGGSLIWLLDQDAASLISRERVYE